MDNSIFLLSIVIASTLILFISNRIRLDLIAIIACLALAWLGLISPLEAISGFSSNAVVAMASVMILGYGIERTGVTSRLASSIIRYAGTSERRIITTVSMTVGLLSSVMQNIGASALFLPALRRIGKQTAIPDSHLMMPMGFAAILGGTVTMIGSGPMILLNDLLRQNNLEPFSMFAVTPVGLPLLVAGIAIFALAGSRILPDKKERKCQPTVAEIWGIDLILAGILTPEEAYHAIDWKSVVLIGGLIPFGIAMENTGASRLIASSFVDLLAGAHPIAVMLSIATLTTALSLIISNVAAIVLLVPLVLLLSAGIGVDPRALALLVAVSSQNSFILPTHQVNALLMDPGGYTTRDYLQAGGIMTVLFICIATLFIYLFV